jgi:asparagine synthase (glutamine-hydrolysing)
VCGIVGIYNLNGEPVALDLLRRMTDALRHRGPDDEGHYTDGNFGLGNRRLSIIDLSPGGHMPMSNEGQTLWISHNGEVYNYPELARDLKAGGHVFRSQTDTETILHAYEAHGAGCLSGFNGMFAFAIWDVRRRRLFCARDRLGVKPLYYYFDGQVFVFASEIKAILLHPRLRRRVNEAAVYDFLAFALTDHTGDTFFDGIRRLPPAHYLTLDADGALRIERWWDVDSARLGLSQPGGDIRATGEQLRHLLTDSIRLRLRSDVPVGTCLSGGLDSSSVVSLVNQLIQDEGVIAPHLVGERQKTFSSCFDDPRFDERPFIEAVAAQTGVERNYVFPDGYQKLWQEASDLVWYQEEPFSSTSIYAQWNVMRLAAERSIKVLLDGQGGDELMAGYPRYFATFAAHLARQGRFLTLAKEIAAFRITGQNLPFLLAIALYLAAPPWLKALGERSITRARTGHTLDVLNPDFKHRFEHRPYEHFAGVQSRYDSDLSLQLCHDATVYTLPGLLRYEDKNSMAFSIEARVPFLDYRLVEFLLSLPPEYHIHNGWTKWSLRQAMAGVLPEAVRWRRDKKGFPTPEMLWLRAGQERISALFTGAEVRSRAYLDPRQIRDRVATTLAGRDVGFSEVWRWINLELWMRCFNLP